MFLVSSLQPAFPKPPSAEALHVQWRSASSIRRKKQSLQEKSVSTPFTPPSGNPSTHPALLPYLRHKGNMPPPLRSWSPISRVYPGASGLRNLSTHHPAFCIFGLSASDSTFLSAINMLSSSNPKITFLDPSLPSGDCPPSLTLSKAKLFKGVSSTSPPSSFPSSTHHAQHLWEMALGNKGELSTVRCSVLAPVFL